VSRVIRDPTPSAAGTLDLILAESSGRRRAFTIDVPERLILGKARLAPLPRNPIFSWCWSGISFATLLTLGVSGFGSGTLNFSGAWCFLFSSASRHSGEQEYALLRSARVLGKRGICEPGRLRDGDERIRRRGDRVRSLCSDRFTTNRAPPFCASDSSRVAAARRALALVCGEDGALSLNLWKW